MNSHVLSSRGETVVAVINTSPDVVDLLRETFRHAGLRTVSAFTYDIRDGRVDLDAFLAAHDPRVVVYDIALPYEENWELFRRLCTKPSMQRRSFVLTTTNAAQVQRLVGRETRVYEIVGKPFDLDRLSRAVKEASRSRPIF